jgi:anti-anti-sigma factor
VVGALDAATVRPLQELARTITAPTRILVDLGGTTFLDSSALHALHALRVAGGSLRVVQASEAARRVIELMGLGERFGLEG